MDSLAIQAFYPTQTSVVVDKKVAHNPLLHIASTVMCNCKKKPMNNQGEDIFKSDWYLKYKKLNEERRKTVKTGDNVIHLSYLRGLIDSEELRDIEENLKQSQIELSSFDKSGLAQNAFEEYLNVIYIAISTPLISNILTGVVSSIVWDSIKVTVKKVWVKVRNKEYTKLTAGSQEKKKITFGLEIKLDKNTSFNFRLDGDLSEELIEKSLDKAFNYLKEQQLNENYKHSYFMTFNSTNENWNKLDVEEELRTEMLKRHKNQDE